ncbi:MAG: hypothetical protein DSY99_02175, partial [Candidatus Neomarinimicrobiota bacterium]
YTLQKNVFLFGSEIKAILAHPNYQTEINREALLEYFTFQNFFNDRTLFKDVRLLPQGTFLRVPHGTQQLPSPQEYWDYEFGEPNDLKDETEYIEELDRLIRQAVNRQLVSDVEVGSYLSGGMDTGVHEEVLKNGDAVTGCTIHFVTEDVDGGPILIQKKCDVVQNETIDSLKTKVQALEGRAFIEAIQLIQKKSHVK